MSALPPLATGGVAAELVGREDVLALAIRRWDEGRDGTGQVLLMSGEAGIGKSRMIAEIAAALPGARVLTATAWPAFSEVTGSLLVDLVRGLRRSGDAATASALHERLAIDDAAGDQARRRRLLVTSAAELIGRILPGTLLRFEDLHWADEISLEVIERLAVLVRSTGGMIVATYRSDEVFAGTPLARWRTRLLESRLAEEVRLPRLPREGTARLAEALLGQIPSSEYVDQLHQRGEGIPLYIEELVADGASHSVPGTVADAVHSRVEQLTPAARELAVAASVIGTGFSLDLLMAVVPDDAATVDAALTELRDRHLLVGTGDSGEDFDFRHALIRDAIYDRIAPNRRRALHAAVARASRDAGMRDAYLSEQFELAHQPRDAHVHAKRAAEGAKHASAHREAAALYARALRTAPDAAGEDELARLHARFGIELAAIDDNEGAAREIELAIEIFRRSGDLATAAAVVSNLMSARHALGDGLAVNVARAEEAIGWLDELPGGGPAATRADLYSALAAAYMLDRRLDEALDFGERAATLAINPEDQCDRLNIAITLGPVLAFAGRTDEAWRMLDDAIAEASAPGTDFEVEAARGYRMIGSSASVLVEYELAEERIRAGLDVTKTTERWNDHHYLRSHLAHVLWATGRLDEAEHEARQALADGHGITTEITARHVLGYLAIARGGDDALSHLERARTLGMQMNELQRIVPAVWGLAELAVFEGRFADAVALSEEAFARCAAVTDAAYLFPFVVTGTRARLGARDAGAARDWLDRAGALLRIRNIAGTLPALDHAEGLISQAEGRATEAREHFDRALAGWTAAGRYWERTQLLVDLARTAQRTRRPGETAGFAAEARRIGESSGATVLVALAESVNIGTESTGTGPLTAREFEVAKLVAAGATNREIAERLVISPKTASAHLEHILAKLGVARRAEIAAWVSRAGEPAG